MFTISSRFNTKLKFYKMLSNFTEKSDHLQVRNLYNQALPEVPNAILVMYTKARLFIMFDNSAWLNHQIIKLSRF